MAWAGAYLLALQSLLQLQSHWLGGADHAGAHVGAGVHARHGEVALWAHLVHHGVEATRLARHGVVVVALLHGHAWGAGVALAVHGLLVHHHGGILPRERLCGLLPTLTLERAAQTQNMPIN